MECHMTWPNKPLKRGDIRTRTRDDLTAVVCIDKHDMYVLTNMHNPPATEGNFCDKHGNTLKLQTVQDYNQHIGYFGKGDRMTNRYSIQWQTWKWTKTFFFSPVRPYYCKQLPPYIMWCQNETNFRLALVRNLIENAGSLPCFCCPIGRSAAIEREVTQLEVNFSNHWPVYSSRVNCHTCFTRGIQKRVQVKCKECDVELCIGVLKCTTKNTKCDVLRSAGRFWSHNKSHQTGM
jgi:hypothetical protein